jgi:peptidoglycan/LPS O-acetylase OafA/YrhL
MATVTAIVAAAAEAAVHAGHRQTSQLFLLGLLVMACAVAGLFFLRFWRRTRDRLFAIFAAAIWLLGLNWLLLAFTHWDEPTTSWLYLIRLLAFMLILIGVLDKNRARPQG